MYSHLQIPTLEKMTPDCHCGPKPSYVCNLDFKNTEDSHLSILQLMLATRPLKYQISTQRPRKVKVSFQLKTDQFILGNFREDNQICISEENLFIRLLLKFIIGLESWKLCGGQHYKVTEKVEKVACFRNMVFPSSLHSRNIRQQEIDVFDSSVSSVYSIFSSLAGIPSKVADCFSEPFFSSHSEQRGICNFCHTIQKRQLEELKIGLFKVKI